MSLAGILIKFLQSNIGRTLSLATIVNHVSKRKPDLNRNSLLTYLQVLTRLGYIQAKGTKFKRYYFISKRIDDLTPKKFMKEWSDLKHKRTKPAEEVVEKPAKPIIAKKVEFDEIIKAKAFELLIALKRKDRKFLLEKYPELFFLIRLRRIKIKGD